MIDQNSSVLEIALWWADAGVPVFPCKGNKAPLTENGHNDATTDPAKVKSLFEFFGDKAELVGGRMGKESGLFAVDLDTYKPGVEAYAKGLQDNGSLPPTRTHRTKSGGLHMIYEASDQPNCKPHSGVDVKGEGGYIILAPSPGYEVLSEGVKKAPGSLLAELKAARAARNLSSNDALEANILRGDDFHESITQLAARYAKQGKSQSAIQSEIMRIMDASVASSPHHQRHARWSSIMRDGGGELTRAVTSANAKFNDASASEAMRDMVGLAAQGVATEAGFFDAPNEEANAETFTGEEWPFEGLGYFAHEEIDVKAGRFTLYPLYAENETVVLFAEPKTGKTAFALTTALHIAVGMDFGPLKVAEAGPTLYYGLEGRRAIELRVESWKRHMADTGAKLPAHIPMFTVTKSTNFIKEDVRRTEANRIIAADKYCKAKEGKALQVIFIDTLTKAMSGGDQNSVEDTSALFDLVSMLRDAGVVATVVFVHHKGRAGNVRGSTNIEAEPDVLLDLSKNGPRVQLKVARARSIEDGMIYDYTLHGYDLGETAQGFKQSGLYVKAVDAATDVASDEMREGQNIQKQLQIIVDLEKDGISDASLVVKAMHTEGLLGFAKKAPSIKAALVQKTLQELAPVAGRVFGDSVIHPIKDGHSIVSFQVRKMA